MHCRQTYAFGCMYEYEVVQEPSTDSCDFFPYRALHSHRRCFTYPLLPPDSFYNSHCKVHLACWHVYQLDSDLSSYVIPFEFL